MSANLRAGFKERHHKHLYEAIDMVPPPTKKACPKKAREETEREAPTTPVPQLDVMGPSNVPVDEKKVGPALGAL